MLQRVLLLFSFLFLAFPVNAYYDIGVSTGFVNDRAKILTVEQQQLLENKLSQFEKTSGNEIVVVILPSLQDDTIDNFAEVLFKKWGIGKEKIDNGVLLLVAMEERVMRIEVGYGLEGALTDAQSSQIIKNQMKPHFKAQNYYQGIDAGVNQIISAVKGEYVPLQSTTKGKSSRKSPLFLLILAFVVLDYIAVRLRKTKSYWLGGLLGGVTGSIIGFIVFGTVAAVLLSAAIIGVLGLFFDYFISKNPGGGGGSGSGLWFGGFGGSGGGGFSGLGGGMSGGGGSSDDW